MISRVVLSASLCVACSVTEMQDRTDAPRRVDCLAGSLPDSVTPSREGFFREALFAAATARTPRYDAYTQESYHADKVDIADGLPAMAKACGLVLRALVIVGPVGPLWAY